MILVREIRLPITAKREEVIARSLKMAGLVAGDVTAAEIHKISVDARHGTPSFVYTVALSLPEGVQYTRKQKNTRAVQVVNRQPFSVLPGSEKLAAGVVVCGLGPAGLFAALELAEAGFAPTVLERGPAMKERAEKVKLFTKTGALDTAGNIQFGEGGAGTFSDGKLTTRIKDPLCARVTERLLAAGAPAEIAWLAKPHIGTDKLRAVITKLRKQIEALGGRVLFNTQLTGLVQLNGRLAAVQTTAGQLPCGALLLAPGHSARDTFSALHEDGLHLTAKDFSVGFRAEHLQRTIDEGLYHEAAGHPLLPPGEYSLSARVGGRGVYTFCMCPGGFVVAAASEENGVVTNGMSLHARSGSNANAAVVAGVSAERDFGGDPFKAIAFQRQLEQAAFTAGGGGYTAPAETLGSFLHGKGQLNLGRVQPTYPRGVRAANLGALLPADITESLRGAFKAFGRKLPGYDAADTLLTGLETRTSSPVRMPRSDACESTDITGVYPCGEGAGFAGGIMSAATDGVRVASSIISRFAPPR